MFHIHLKEDSPIPNLQTCIEKQRSEGGRLVIYQRVWSAVFISMSQRRIAWIPPHGSRITPGLKHCLFSLLFGIWGATIVGAVPMCLIINLRGGIDVTAELSSTPIDPLRPLPLSLGQSRRDATAAQWSFVFFGLLAILLILYFTVWR